MSDCAENLRQLAAVLDEAKQEINLSRQQCNKSDELEFRIRRTAVQAARAVAAAVDLGFTEIWPPGPWELWSLRDPEDTGRTPIKMHFHRANVTVDVKSINYGSGCNSDGTLREDTAIGLWVNSIYPVLRRKQTASKAAAGAFNIPKSKTDEQGQLIGRDGKQLTTIERIDPETRKPVGMELSGSVALVTDDYDQTDWLHHFRCQAADWADACDVAANLIRTESQRSPARPELKGGIRKKDPVKKRGRIVDDHEHAARGKLNNRWLFFKDNYRDLDYTSASYENFTQWAVDKYEDMPSDDPVKIEKMIKAYRRTPHPKRVKK